MCESKHFHRYHDCGCERGLVIRPDLYGQVVDGVVVQLSGKRDKLNTAKHGKDRLYVGITLSSCQIERLLDSIYGKNYNFPWKPREAVRTHVCCHGVHVTLPISRAHHNICNTYEIYLEKHVKKIIEEAVGGNHCCHCR